MATFGQPPTDPRKLMAPVNPRVGFPVQNQGGLPQTPTVAPPKPFVTSPTVGAQPGPAGIPALKPVTPQAPIATPQAPAPGVPAAPTTAPTAPTPASTSTSTSSSSGASGQTGVISPSAQGNLEGQLQQYIAQGINGNAVSRDFINRARADVSRNVWGQERAATQQINDDAVRRGLYRSGIPAESIANVHSASQGAIAAGVADILNNAENVNVQGRQNAAGAASDLLGMNRSWEQYQNQRADEAAARAGANKPDTWDYIDPDTGERVTIDNSWFF